jgi:hypothetical protein
VDINTYARLEIYQDRSRDVTCVVRLVEKDVLSIAAFSREVLKVSILADSVFLAKLLPELASNYGMSVLIGAISVVENVLTHCYCHTGLLGW